MAAPKSGTAKDGSEMHYSVGAVIKRGGKYLLVDRAKFPPGYAGIAGHVDEGEGPEGALIREVKEEGGYRVKKCKRLFEEELANECRRGVKTHKWSLYECEVEGDMEWNPEETKSIGWYSPDEMKRLALEPVWEYWFRKLKVLD